MENTEAIEVGQTLYYLGLGWGMKTHCSKVYEKDGVRYVVSNNNAHRKEADVLANTCDLFTSKEEINKRLSQSWMADLL